MAGPTDLGPTDLGPTVASPTVASPVAPDGERGLATDVRRLEDLGDELAAVDAVLGRLDEGTYGTCEVCGARLDQAALAAQPTLTRCPAHPAVA